MSQALYRKWRPRGWDEVVSQEHVIQTLRNAVTGNRVVHAYLFSGPRGTGKTTAARLLAKAVNCLEEDLSRRPCNTCAHCVAVNENRFMDLIEIDAASNTSVEDVRDLRDKINFAPSQGRFKVYVVDEAHMLSNAAFNALLKTLEEPPPHAIFVLATTEMHKIPATVVSRCQRHEFRRLPLAEIVRQLALICEKEEIDHEPDALTTIARQSAGGMRDAISLLDQLASTGERITVELVQTVLGTATSSTVLSLVDAIQTGDAAAGLAAIHAALDAGSDSRALARQIVEYFRAVMLVQMGNGDQVEAPAEVRARMAAHAAAFSRHQLLGMTRAFNAAATEVRGGWQPALGLELAFAEVLELEGQPAAISEQVPVSSKQPPVGRQPKGVEVAPREAPPRPRPSGERPGASAREPEPGASVTKASASEVVGQSEISGRPQAVTLEQVTAAIREMLPELKNDNPQLVALLRSVRQVDLADGAVVLTFQGEVLASKMESPEMMEPARQALHRILGVDLPIRCIVRPVGGKSSRPDVRPDGMVAEALHKGGEIVDIQ
jgi:DNA polymerase-3 subunit gamma/tau